MMIVPAAIFDLDCSSRISLWNIELFGSAVVATRRGQCIVILPVYFEFCDQTNNKMNVCKREAFIFIELISK